ncbi:MAG: hypothetical protein LBK06_05900 [Planctomycetaceae bacterium]|nr:hypothetical protein [Planctomycetaceae bacterium]
MNNNLINSTHLYYAKAVLKFKKYNNTNPIIYAEAVLQFAKLNTAAQQREAVVQGRSLLPYRLRYISRNRQGKKFHIAFRLFFGFYCIIFWGFFFCVIF